VSDHHLTKPVEPSRGDSIDERCDMTVVIPVRDEEKNIPELVERLAVALQEMQLTFELIFVTDINTDQTLSVLRECHARDNRIKVIKLANGKGQHIAVVAGLDASRGDSVVLMDGDLQDYPEDIRKLRSRMLDGFDVVYGIKENKDDSAIRNILSKIFVRVMNKLSDYSIEHSTSMFRIISRRTVDELHRFRESEQSLTGLISLIGFPTDKVLVTSGERKAGETKYSFAHQINFAIGFLLSFSTKPLRVISVLGLIVSGMSFLYLGVVLVQALFAETVVMGWPTLVVLMTFLGGIQLLALGVIGEYISRIFIESKRRPIYIVEEKIGDFE
jgi:glycosyltransferase involved in cell wall biosynthesis